MFYEHEWSHLSILLQQNGQVVGSNKLRLILNIRTHNLNVDENIIIIDQQIKHINNEKVKDFYEISSI